MKDVVSYFQSNNCVFLRKGIEYADFMLFSVVLAKHYGPAKPYMTAVQALKAITVLGNQGNAVKVLKPHCDTKYLLHKH